MSEKQSNFFTPTVIFWCIFTSVIFIITNVTFQPVRNFFFISMFGNMFNSAPSFLSAFLAIGTFCGVIAAAIFYQRQATYQKWQASAQERQADAIGQQSSELSRQANIMALQMETFQKQHLLDTERSQHDMFTEAVRQMDIEKTTLSWHAGLIAMSSIAEANPTVFGENAINLLVKAGQYFTRAKVGKSKSKQDEINYFNFLLVHAISDTLFEIAISPNTKLKQIIYIDKIDVTRTSQIDIKILQNGYFEGVTFGSCDFSGIKFENTFFENATFYDGVIINFDQCYISGNNDNITNKFWKSNFDFGAYKSAIKDSQIGNLNKKTAFFEKSIKVIPDAEWTEIVTEMKKKYLN
ncbi:MAG: hypothetical protein OCD03_02760 [Hyphomicrobiales bacterium]